MKLKVFILIFTLITLTGCDYTQSESVGSIKNPEDQEEILLARKSIEYIQYDKREELISILHKNLSRSIEPNQLDWLFENGQRIIESNEYPSDSLIMVTYISRKSALKEIQLKEFIFPFINTSEADSTMFIEITFLDGEIYKLYFSTGWRKESN